MAEHDQNANLGARALGSAGFTESAGLTDKVRAFAVTALISVSLLSVMYGVTLHRAAEQQAQQHAKLQQEAQIEAKAQQPPT